MDQKVIWDYYQGIGQDSFQDAFPRLRYLVESARKLRFSNTSSVLNIGVGNGYLETAALQQGFNPFSLDPSEIAIQKIQESGMQGKVGYIESIPYADGAFEFVFCSEVLEHLTVDSLTQAMAEIKRVLKPHGYLIGTVPFNEILSANTVICPDCNHRFHRWGHEQTFDQSSLENLLIEAGLKVVRLETRAFPTFEGKNIVRKTISLGRALLGRLGFEFTSPNLFFVARKD